MRPKHFIIPALIAAVVGTVLVARSCERAATCDGYKVSYRGASVCVPKRGAK